MATNKKTGGQETAPASKVVPAATRKPPNAGKGRKKGVPNKITRELKEMILAALDKAGGTDYLVKQAGESPAAFMTLLGKVLPLQVTGKDGGPIEARVAAEMTPDQRREEIRKLLTEQPQLAALMAAKKE